MTDYQPSGAATVIASLLAEAFEVEVSQWLWERLRRQLASDLGVSAMSVRVIHVADELWQAARTDWMRDPS